MSQAIVIEEYEFHPYSRFYPMLPKDEIIKLAEDIAENGLINPIVLLDGMILDGRNRYKACLYALNVLRTKFKKVNLRFKKYDLDIHPLSFVELINGSRRHLTPAQRMEACLLIVEEKKKIREEELRKIEKRMKKDLEKEINGKTKEEKEKLIEEEIEKTRILLEHRDIVASARVQRVTPEKVIQVRKIKEIAMKDPSVASEWEKAKKGKTSVKRIMDTKIDKKPKKPTKEQIIKEKTKRINELSKENVLLLEWCKMLYIIINDKTKPTEELTDKEKDTMIKIFDRCFKFVK